MTRGRWYFVGATLAVSLSIAGLLSPFASSAPDGLERVAENLGFAHRGAGEPVWRWPVFPDYAAPGIGPGWLATSVAGLLGTSLVFGCGVLLGRALRRRGPESGQAEPPCHD